MIISPFKDPAHMQGIDRREFKGDTRAIYPHPTPRGHYKNRALGYVGRNLWSGDKPARRNPSYVRGLEDLFGGYYCEKNEIEKYKARRTRYIALYGAMLKKQAEGNPEVLVTSSPSEFRLQVVEELRQQIKGGIVD